MIRVAHLITDLEFGGAERVLASLVKASDPARFSHQVISMTGVGPIGQSLAEIGVEVQALGMRSGIPSVTAALKLLRILRHSSPDLLQCWMYHANLLGLLAEKLTAVPRLVWGIRCSNMDFSNYRPLTRWVVKLGGRLSCLVDLIIVNSEAGKAVHVRWSYQKGKMIVVPNGIDLERFKPECGAHSSVCQELALPQDSLLVGLIARFDPMKDHATFFKASALLIKMLPGVHFLLAGGRISRENAELYQMVRENGLDGHVHLLGPRDDIPRLTAALDIASSSSAFGEGFCNAIGEAMACAVPCVATDVGDSAYLVGDTGRIVPPSNPGALAAAWGELIQAGPARRQELGERARQRIKESFSLDQVVARYESLYEELMNVAPSVNSSRAADRQRSHFP